MEQIIPDYKYFEAQRKDEQVVLIARRHWIVYLSSFVVGGGIILSLVIFSFFLDEVSVLNSSATLMAIAVCANSLLMLFTVLFVYVSWLIHYLNFQMVTNEHVVDIDQLGLFSRNVSELSLDDIQDVSASQHGILQSMLHYGDVVIQTAGEKPNFTFEKVGEPYAIAKQLMDVKDQYGHGVASHSHEETP